MELIDPRRFGVLQNHPNSISLDAPVIKALQEAGLGTPDEAFGRALSAALIDLSYLYENEVLFPGLTKSHLDALSALGAAFLRRTAMIDAYQSPGATAPSMSMRVARCSDSFAAWATERTWLTRSVTLGRGLVTAVNLPRKVITDLGMRLLGLLCLLGRDDVAARLVADLVLKSKESAKIDDVKTVLQVELKPDVPVYEFVQEGPDHSKTFYATVIDARGRRGHGTGVSKKTASNAAAEDFLATHGRRRTPTPVQKPGTAARPTAVPPLRAHMQVVRRLRDVFALPQEAEPLLSQALIHPSWTYEQKPLVARCGQQDNLALGFVGSEVLVYEYALAAVRRLMDTPRPAEFAFLSLENQVYDTAFQQADLASGLLLGAGQAQLGTTSEIRANSFQALIGAIAAVRRFPSSLRSTWPAQWRSIWEDIAPEHIRAADPTTQLSKLTAIVPLEIEYTTTQSGAHHLKTWVATANIHAPALGLRTTVQGTAEPTKTRAKHNASEKALAAFDYLVDGSGIRALTASSEAQTLARFLLAMLVAAIPSSSHQLTKWASARLCGLHLVDDRPNLADWAHEADHLLGDLVTGWESLSDAFRTLRAVDELDPVDLELAKTLDVIEHVTEPDQVTQEHIDRVIQLCDVHRCLGSEEEARELSAVAESLRLRYRTRLAIPADLPPTTMSSREHAALSAAAAAVLASRTDATLEVRSGRALELTFRSSGPADRAHFKRMSRLWNATVPTLEMTALDTGIDVRITAPDIAPVAGIISRAAYAALVPQADQYRSSLADLLHDLKNQLAAARVAAADAGARDTRTAQLQHQLAASKHLDEAHMLALRLKAAASAFTSSVIDGDLELGTFLRDYAGRVLSWLPPSISLYVPAAERSARVAISAPLLSAVLDNLVKNAAEAMPGGGSINIVWTADRQEALVGIEDTGPGLPTEVAEAWTQRKRIHSTKAAGNGLGLWSAQALVSRIGGGLTLPPRTDRGTEWLLALPLTTDTGSGS